MGNATNLEDFSRVLLGGRHQAAIGAAIAESSEPVWGKSLLGDLGLDESAKSMVSGELKRLRRARLLVPSPENDPNDRRHRFDRADPANPYWELCLQLKRRAEEGHGLWDEEIGGAR